ncbi:MAG: response regulator [Alphaproteobacteria bacterium]
MNTRDYSRMTVLVVEDENMMRQLLARVLHDIGFGKVLLVEDGAEGLQRLETTPEGIDLIILDLEMPIISGLEFLQMLRSSNTIPNRQMPVIVVSGHSEEKNLHEAVKLGVHGFLVKPLSRSALEQRIEHAFKSTTIDPTVLSRIRTTTSDVQVLDFNKKK